MLDDPARPPRFPCVGALLCAACVGAAAWTWMRYSYCWEVTPWDFWQFEPELYNPSHDVRIPNLSYAGRYVVLTGRPSSWPSADGDCMVASDDNMAYAYVSLSRDTEVDNHRGGEAAFTGRVIRDAGEDWPWLDTTASRFTGASIAGLVVGAMGVFVFGAALRHWLNQRRRFGDPGPGR